MATTKPVAIIAGVGSGTGAALADEINQSGGEAVGISTDVSSEESVKNAFVKIKKIYGGAPVAAVIFNASTRPSRKPFLELTAEEFGLGYEVSVYVVAT
jgi:NAD(P)-dependent dehydrogenase (short-subunit alcohol dehydrogenase family)